VRARMTDGGACIPIAIPMMMATVPMLTSTMGMRCGVSNAYSSFWSCPPERSIRVHPVLSAGAGSVVPSLVLGGRCAYTSVVTGRRVSYLARPPQLDPQDREWGGFACPEPEGHQACEGRCIP
jgi:hypothetical protein